MLSHATCLLLGYLVMFISVGVHYEILGFTTTKLNRVHTSFRLRVALGVLAAIAAHLIEIGIFSLGWIFLLQFGFGTLSVPDPDVVDISYLSIVTYTSLGYGDIVPQGAIRLYAGIEVLSGVVLTAWTASFTFFEMHRYWGRPI
jgi:hypothetical protein